MVAAVELRTDPTASATGSRCSTRTPRRSAVTARPPRPSSRRTSRTAWRLDQGRGGRLPGGRGFPWEASTTHPATTPVAWPTVPTRTTATAPAGGRHLEPRRDHQPGHHGAAAPAPRLSFDHYMATEAGYDGGNVKISVNGGAFTVVPASAYVFNAPTASSTPRPRQHQPDGRPGGFTGTDGGQVSARGAPRVSTWPRPAPSRATR